MVNAVRTDEFDAVCEEHGEVLDNSPPIMDVPFIRAAISKSYSRIFHFNERMALFMLQDPPIPDPLFELIEDEAWTGYLEGRYPHPDDVWFRDISKICSSVKVPPPLQEEFRSQKFKMLPLVSLSKYKEKWLTIKYRLSGVSPVPREAAEAVVPLREYFRALQAPWDYITRRRNFINYNLVINIGLERIGMPQYKVFFPMVRGKKKLRELCVMMMDMFRFLNWEPTATLSRYAGVRRSRRTAVSSGPSGYRPRNKGRGIRPKGRPRRIARTLGGTLLKRLCLSALWSLQAAGLVPPIRVLARAG